MRRRSVRIMGVAAALILTTTVMPSASAAALPSCSKGTSVKVVKGKATMLLKGKRVACKLASKPTTSSTLAPSVKPEIRFTSGLLNDLIIKPNLTITLRNFETSTRTLVITGAGGFTFRAEPVDPIADSVAGMGAFLSPSKPGTYTLTFLENPSAKATLTVIP